MRKNDSTVTDMSIIQIPLWYFMWYDSYQFLAVLRYLSTHILYSSFRGLEQSFDYPSLSKVTEKDIGKLDQYLTTVKYDKAWTVFIFLGMYCTRSQPHDHNKNS